MIPRKDYVLISVEDALNKILDVVNVLGSESKHLLDCLGQVLAEDVYAPFNVPPQDNSAMDGYAVQFASIQEASDKHPKILTVIGDVAAGSISRTVVEAETATRIMTGAFLPQGADVVVPFEDTDEAERKESSLSKSEIGIRHALPLGANIRRSGEDISEGKLVITKGEVVCPAAIGVLASLGKESIHVIRRPVIGILATGDELLELNQERVNGKIYNSNSYALAGQIIHYGGIPKLLGIARDDFQQLSAALHSGLDCDLLITSGGVSLGDYDIVKQVLAAEGDISFWTVRMKPGKPLAFGTLVTEAKKKIPLLGLPGNPVSSMITFEVFARPAICKMMGMKDLIRHRAMVIMDDSVKNIDGRRVFARVVVSEKEGKYFAKLTGSQGSGILTSILKANALAVIPETVTNISSGDVVEAFMLD